MKTVAILTTFQDLNPGYSLTGIVVDQIHMLARHGHKVLLFVSEQFNPKHNDDSGLCSVMDKYPGQVELLKKTKFIHLIDYEENTMIEDHEVDAKEAGQSFADLFIKHQVDIAFTHDFVFTGWNLPYFYGVIEANNILRDAQENCLWYHWIHSVPIPEYRKPWWNMNSFGKNHYLVFPNRTDLRRVAESYQVAEKWVKAIPHIKDIRTWYSFGEDAMEFLDKYPEVMKSKIIQVYPCSSDRMWAKQLGKLIRIFSNFKKAGVSCFLVVANQWATGKQPKEDIKQYIDSAKELGLSYGEDFVFTSEADEKWGNGISRKMLRELQLLQNLFIFPTMEESFGLVGPEAAFSGSLNVINRSLTMQYEVMGHHAPAYEFGSFHNRVSAIDDPEQFEKYCQSIAMSILNNILSNEAIMTKNWCRLAYNMDRIYFDYYLPLMG